MLNYNNLNEGLNQIYSNVYEEYNDCLNYIKNLDIDKRFEKRQINKLNNLWNEILKDIFKKSENAFSYKYNNSSYNARYERIIYRNKIISIEYYIVYNGCTFYDKSHFKIFIEGELIAEFYKESENIIYNTDWLNIIDNIINNIKSNDLRNEFKQIKQQCKEYEEKLFIKERQTRENLLNNIPDIKDYI